MIKESKNLVRALQEFAKFGDDTARITKEIGKKNTARFNSIFNRNLAAAQEGKPFDQTFMDIMYPRIERMFVNNQLPARDFRRIYSKSKLFNTAKDTILARNDALHSNGVYFNPKRFSRAEQREGLQYVRGLRNSTDISKKFSNRLELLDEAIEGSQRHMSNVYLPRNRGIYVKPNITSFAKSQGFLSREDLLRQAKKENIILNKNDLHEPFYIDKGTSLASSQAVPKSPWIRDVIPAVNNELEHTAANITKAKKALQQAPRSIQRAAAIVNGQNILQPGTRAHRLYLKTRRLKSNLMRRVSDDIAFYSPEGNYIAISPQRSLKFKNKTLSDPVATEAHERGHFFAHNLPEAEHRAIAKNLFTKLKRAADRYNLTIPFDDPGLMQEAFADGYAALKLGTVEPLAIRLNNVFYDAKRLNINPLTYRNNIRNLKKINNAKDLDDVTKQMLNQLQINYSANIFKNWK